LVLAREKLSPPAGAPRRAVEMEYFVEPEEAFTRDEIE